MLYVNHTSVDRDALSTRLLELWERTGSPSLEALAHGRAPVEGASVETPQLFIDWVSTCLMDTYKDTGEAAVFALLFELNRASFLHAIVFLGQGAFRTGFWQRTWSGGQRFAAAFLVRNRAGDGDDRKYAQDQHHHHDSKPLRKGDGVKAVPW